MAEGVPDLVVTRDGNPSTVGRVPVDVVPGAVAEELAAGPGEFPDELTAVHSLDLNVDGLHSRRGWLFGCQKLVESVPDVLLELREGLPLAHDGWVLP
jgi:hypothetical protein